MKKQLSSLVIALICGGTLSVGDSALGQTLAVSREVSVLRFESVAQPAATLAVSREASVRLTLCNANCDASMVEPILNVADFICFTNAYAAGNPYANCDASTVQPVLNVADFVCFLNLFAAGCT
ncbi:MAG: GC-type dockerin domain-anchored protein [Phycisphaerales bacterium]